MPTSPPKLCPTCKSRYVAQRCPTCYPAWRPSAGKRRRGSTRASRRLRRQVLAEQPICAGYPPGTECDKLAVEDDHIVPWAQRRQHGMTDRQWDDRDNHQGLCAPHHREKTKHESTRRP